MDDLYDLIIHLEDDNTWFVATPHNFTEEYIARACLSPEIRRKAPGPYCTDKQTLEGHMAQIIQLSGYSPLRGPENMGEVWGTAFFFEVGGDALDGIGSVFSRYTPLAGLRQSP